MGSPAYAKYLEGASHAARIRAAASDPRIRPITREQSLAFAHASLAAVVASWDAYLNELARNFYAETANALDPPFHAMHSIARAAGRNTGKRFNTPNWENSRTFLIQVTGFDPIAHWTWPARGMGVPQVQERMNQILKVRHSFAHGSSIPTYPWNRTPTGRVSLRQSVLIDIESFFNNIVKRTDAGMASHLNAAFGRTVSW